ncbi:MAG: hypothetical protein A2234_07140 [Elusimicrobia bacterium RIFOXYA2_FULL_58_8]|nr:MAG: hypothetical protein A2234_07140 [Elusimicrobia bacterium RIFOXYA2_FULL_58_8]OGS13908.1 MAG: hypothetical protein A2285_09595 [Elusimicrobia bacterium RIFOXYA12_FULL_57_11]
MPALLKKLSFAGRAAFLVLAVIVAAGGALRLRYYAAESRHEVTGYYSLAVNLKATGVFAYPGSPYTPTAYRAPLYPVFLSLFAGEDMRSMRAAFWAQLFIFLLTVLLVWAAAGLASGSAITALAAAAIYSFHPQAVASQNSFDVEFFYGFLLAAVALAMTLAADTGRFKYWLTAFAAAGISITCKSPMAFFPVFLAGWLYFRRTGGEALKKRLPLLLAAAYLAVVPWTLRNVKHFRAFIPLERNAVLCNIYSAGAGMPGTCLPSLARKLYAQERGGELYSPGTGALTLIKHIIMRPGKYVSGFLKRLPLVFGAFPFLFVFSLAGLWLYRKNEGMLLVGLLGAYFTGVHLAFSFEYRYLVPILPLLSMLAAVPLGKSLEYKGKPVPRFIGRSGAVYCVVAAVCVILVIYGLSAGRLAGEVLRTDLKLSVKDEVETLVAVVKTANNSEISAYYNQQGVLKLFSGQYKLAKADFKSAISANPHFPDPYLNMAFTMSSLGEVEEALAVCRAAEGAYAAGASGGGFSYSILDDILECQEIRLKSLGREKDAVAVAERRAVFKKRNMTELLR